MMLANTGRCVGPSRGLPPGRDSIEKRSADEPLDGFGRLTAGTLGALTHSTLLRVILSLPAVSLSNPSNG